MDEPDNHQALAKSSQKPLKILCLHGHPGSGEAMQTFVEYFRSQGIEAIAPDLRGYGSNRARANFAMTDHIDDLWSLLVENLDQDQHKSPDQQPETSPEYLILGWSLGGILAMELALRSLQNHDAKSSPIPKIAGLILIATAARPRGNLPAIAWWEYVNLAITVSLHRLLRLIPRGDKPISWHIEWFGKRSLIKYLIQQHTQFAYDRLAIEGAKATIQTSRYAHAALNQALRQGYNRNADLPQLDIPCLAIAGEQDRQITAAATAETAKLLPNCEFICYPDTAHLLPWEISDRLLSDIDQWYKRRYKRH